MTSLHESLRKQLEKVVIQARELSEQGARVALSRLGIGSAKAFEKQDRELRNRLRARGRQIGDKRKADGGQETQRLSAELAYEYWHRMLFARFLAENDLLMHQDGVSVSLADCEELAKEEGLANGWLLAERWAARMLPEIFRPADPLLRVPFAPEHEQALEKLLESLPAETFRASDSLGWVYQFWQSKKKDEVNRSGVKIGSDELPAVTQLFTEPYMVHFLLDNTLGAWWMGRHPSEKSPVDFEYLRVLEDGTPAAGTFDGWPKRASELKVLDPCCGSGHFLVAAFLKLVPIRMREEKLSAREACDAVLRDNLHGLEIDPRCTQIAAFAVALTAWSYPGAGGYRQLPQLNIACSGIPISATKEEWLALAQGKQRLVGALEQLYGLFKNAPDLGSLIDPALSVRGDLITGSYQDVELLLQSALESERVERDENLQQAAVSAAGVLASADILSRRHTLVATNVPYLGRAKQQPILRSFCEDRYPRAKYDLATVFIQRALELCRSGGTAALVTPQNWLFLARYRSLRQAVLTESRIHLMAKLGSGAFRAISGEIVNVALLFASRANPVASDLLVGCDVSTGTNAEEKAALLKTTSLFQGSQMDQAYSDDARITVSTSVVTTSLSDYASAVQGLATHDDPQFAFLFWEFPRTPGGWARLAGTVDKTMDFGGRSYIFPFEGGTGRYYEHAMRLKKVGRLGGWKSGAEAWNRRGVSVSQMGNLPCTLHTGDFFDHSAAIIVPFDESDLEAIWCFCSDREYGLAVRTIDSAVKVTNGSLVKVPFDLTRWRAVAAEQYPSGLPEPYSSDPTQWLFEGGIVGSDSPLQVAVARLLGYRWPEQGPDSIDVHADKDGIVCLSSVSGERPAFDRLRDLLAAAYGAEWTAGKQDELLASAGSANATLESWLRDDFFAQHCALFHQRPFIWHIWDGRKDGFAALVNYHKLDRHNLQALIYTYLGDWIKRQEADAKAGKAGADLRLAAARSLQKKLELILEGEPPHELAPI